MRKTRVLILGVFIMINNVYSASQKVWKGSAVLIIKKQYLKEFETAVAKITEPTRKEKGCIFYEGYQVLDENGIKTNRFEFHEIWTSKEAMLIEHKEKSPHMKTFFKEIKIGTKEEHIESFEIDGKWVSILK